jgi:hypothetical protein
MRVSNVSYDIPAQKRLNENDREVVVTKVEDGVWIYIDGYITMNMTRQASPLEQSVIFIDTQDRDVRVHVWSDPEEEDATHVINLKKEQ